jgi:peroxiredoxin
LQQNLEILKSHGASLVAITPQLPEHSRALAEKHRIAFDILTDPGNAYAAQLGLRFALPDDLRAVYQSFGIDLPKHNGDPSWTLPMPGRIVIDRAGIVRAVDVDPDYTRRPEPQKTLDDLAALT